MCCCAGPTSSSLILLLRLVLIVWGCLTSLRAGAAARAVCAIVAVLADELLKHLKGSNDTFTA